MKHDLRRLWLPDFECIPVEVVGQEWPTAILVEKWEVNGLGERRFVGGKTYSPPRDTQLAEQPERISP